MEALINFCVRFTTLAAMAGWTYIAATGILTTLSG